MKARKQEIINQVLNVKSLKVCFREEQVAVLRTKPNKKNRLSLILYL